MNITLYTDGACSGNNGGWAFVLVATSESGNVIKQIENFGAVADTTNNRMEMVAVIEGLNAITRSCRVHIVSDSLYVINTMTQGWKRKKNHDLWQQLDAAVSRHSVTWEHVRGHQGHAYNERCDELAVAARKELV